MVIVSTTSKPGSIPTGRGGTHQSSRRNEVLLRTQHFHTLLRASSSHNTALLQYGVLFARLKALHYHVVLLARRCLAGGKRRWQDGARIPSHAAFIVPPHPTHKARVNHCPAVQLPCPSTVYLCPSPPGVHTKPPH